MIAPIARRDSKLHDPDQLDLFADYAARVLRPTTHEADRLAPRRCAQCCEWFVPKQPEQEYCSYACRDWMAETIRMVDAGSRRFWNKSPERRAAKRAAAKAAKWTSFAGAGGGECE